MFIYISFILAQYLYFSLRKDSIPILNFYLLINIMIFYIPALIYIVFGYTHPSQGYALKNNFNYSQYFANTLSLILLFDLTIIVIFKFLNHLKINLNLITRPFKKIDTGYSEKFIIIFSIIILFICIFFDTLLILINNSLSNKYLIECVYDYFDINQKFNIGEDLKKFIQVFKTITILKYYLICFIAMINKDFKSKVKNIFLIISIIYCLIYGFVLGSKFQIMLPFVILIFIYFENLFKIYNFIIFIIFSYLSLYLFPILGTIRNIFYKNMNEEECLIQENILKSIQANTQYNNSYKENYNAILSIDIQNNPLLLKPMEIILSRLNYFDVTIKIYHYKIKEKLVNNFSYFFDNIYGLIPRFINPQKKIITNSSEIWGVELGIFQHPIHAIGFRPIGEAFLFLGNYYLIIAILIGIFFSLMYQLQNNKIIILNVILTYIVILFLKRDSLHAFLPGILHELIAGFVFIFFMMVSKKLTKIISK